LLPFSAGFVIAGFLLLLWSIIAIFDYYQAFTQPGTITLFADFLPLVITGIVISLGLISGGSFGLYKVLSER
jgi:hypothetical protein